MHNENEVVRPYPPRHRVPLGIGGVASGSPTCLAYARARGRDGTSKTAPRPEKASGTDHGLGRRFLRRSWLPPEKHSGNRNRADCEPIHADPRIAIQMDAENWVI